MWTGAGAVQGFKRAWVKRQIVVAEFISFISTQRFQLPALLGVTLSQKCEVDLFSF